MNKQLYGWTYKCRIKCVILSHLDWIVIWQWAIMPSDWFGWSRDERFVNGVSSRQDLARVLAGAGVCVGDGLLMITHTHREVSWTSDEQLLSAAPPLYASHRSAQLMIQHPLHLFMKILVRWRGEVDQGLWTYMLACLLCVWKRDAEYSNAADMCIHYVLYFEDK